MCLVSMRKAECRVRCVHEKSRLLTVVCFVFRRKARGGSDEDADSGVLCVQEKSGRRQ